MTVLQNVLMGFHPQLPDGLLRTLLGLRHSLREERRVTEKAMELLQFGLGRHPDRHRGPGHGLIRRQLALLL
ncbi:hypothetical protein DPM13_15160 [Paracoccus mutanolyticus]|uniref:Uncharacterized protein n=1 Tax=Paracoccus mutanolyticus TaxID=1499308 RepID=A0ABN5M7J7_9RHOB|nr:hypothetical protein [Paracoccus mutanolyticus]AWX93899.1 hypothetical protein DPM13_15160 [Paracoccus mutanolyticus]